MPFEPKLELASINEQLASAKTAHDELISRASSIPPREEMLGFSASMSQEELRANFKKFLGRDVLPESLEASICRISPN